MAIRAPGSFSVSVCAASRYCTQAFGAKHAGRFSCITNIHLGRSLFVALSCLPAAIAQSVARRFDGVCSID